MSGLRTLALPIIALILLVPARAVVAAEQEGPPPDALNKAVSLKVRNVPLVDVCKYARKAWGINLVLGAALQTRNPLITLELADVSRLNAVTLLARSAAARMAVGDGVMCIGDENFIAGCLQLKPLRSNDDKVMEALALPLDVEFEQVPLADAVQHLRAMMKVNVILVGNPGEAETVTLSLKGVRAGTVCQLAALQVGRRATVKENVVAFGEPVQPDEK